MKNQKPFIIAITLVIAGLVITSSAASLRQSVEIKNSEQINTVGIPTSLSVSNMDVMVCEYSNKVPIVKLAKEDLSLGVDTLIFHDNDEEDTLNPSVVTDASYENVLVFSEVFVDIGQNGMWGRYSSDGGQTWGDEIFGFEEIPEGDPDDVVIPKLDYYGSEEWAYGTWTCGGSYDAQTYFLEMPSIVDPDYDPNGYGWVYYFIDWGGNYDFSDFDSADVACFPYNAAVSPSEDFWGIVAGTGDRPPGTDEEDDTMWFQYSIPGDSSVIWSFYNMDEDCSKMVTDIDMSVGYVYLAMEYEMEADPSDTGTIYYKSPQLRPDNYPSDNWVQDSGWGGYYFDVYNPDMAAADGSVYIVGESEDGDIICLYSSDEGDNFQESIVSDHGIEETFPQVAIVGTDVICSYYRDVDLYAKVSRNGGVTWTNEIKINDDVATAVEQYGGHGIDGPYVAWTDDRNAPPTEIFFDKTFEAGHPPSAPSISGKAEIDPGVSETYSFSSTDEDGDDIAEFIIDWGDGNIETITGPFSSGATATASHTWATRGTFIIKAKAKDTTGLIGPEGQKEIKVPRAKTHDYRFLDIFPNFYRLIKIIFG